VRAITGRDVLYFGELRRLILAENIVQAYHSRRASANWAEWTASNPVYAGLLVDIEKDINGSD
jgi:hypothetical protein